MSAHYAQQVLVRVSFHVTEEQKAALVADAAETGLPMAQILRDMIDAKYAESPKDFAGWHISASVRRSEDMQDAVPARARLREWVSRSRRRR